MKLSQIRPMLKYKDNSPMREAGHQMFLKEYHDQFLLNEIESKSVNEAESKSWTKEQVEKELNVAFPKQYALDTPISDSNDIFLHLYKTHPIDIIKLLQLISRTGWYINTIEISNNSDEKIYHGNNSTAIRILTAHNYIEAILLLQPIRGLAERPIPAFLYHATPTLVWEQKIKPFGLSPRAGQLKAAHPERVYFATSIEYAIKMAENLARAKLQQSQTKKYNVQKHDPKEFFRNWSILEIDTNKIPHLRDGTGYFKLYKDQDSDQVGPHYGIYSKNFIPPTAIKLVKQLDVY